MIDQSIYLCIRLFEIYFDSMNEIHLFIRFIFNFNYALQVIVFLKKKNKFLILSNL